jgi:hypothetical protein
VTVETISDLSGKPDAEPVTFGLDGTAYEIDLTAEEAERFRKAMNRYVTQARKVSPKRKGRRGSK